MMSMNFKFQISNEKLKIGTALRFFSFFIRNLKFEISGILLTCAFAGNAWAHEGHKHLDAREIMHLWPFDEPVTLALLAVSGTLYAVGTARIWRSINKWRSLA